MVVFFQASEWSDLIICPGQELEVWCMFWKIIWEISELIKVEKKNLTGILENISKEFKLDFQTEEKVLSIKSIIIYYY